VNSSKAAISVVQAGELFLHPFNDVLRQNTVQRPHDTITISLCGRLWINFQGREPRNGAERSNVVTDFHAENLPNIRSWNRC